LLESLTVPADAMALVCQGHGQFLAAIGRDVPVRRMGKAALAAAAKEGYRFGMLRMGSGTDTACRIARSCASPAIAQPEESGS